MPMELRREYRKYMTPNEKLYKTVKELDGKFDKSYFLAEVGTADGTSALWELKALAENKSSRWLLTIDPYGGKPYRIQDALYSSFDYDEKKHRNAMQKISNFAAENELNHTHFQMRSQDFIKTFPQIEFWSAGKMYKDPKYCFAFLDGEHAYEPIFEEIEFFYPRMPVGGVIVVDDWNLLGDVHSVRSRLPLKQWKVEFDDFDDNYRIYLTKE